MKRATKIILADDHSIIREGLKPLLEKEPGFQVVGEAENGREAIALAQEHNPDVIIMDISMPDLNGIEATRQILAFHPDCKIIALSVHTDNQFVAQMIRAGAAGYLPKSSAFRELAAAVNTVLQSKNYISPKVIDSVVKYLQSTQDQQSVESELTPREREIVQLLSEGKSTKEISSQLVWSDLMMNNIILFGWCRYPYTDKREGYTNDTNTPEFIQENCLALHKTCFNIPNRSAPC